MARIKFSKRQIAGVLLLSSTAIGATASGTASANAFTKFIGSKVSHAYNWVTDSTVGKVVGIVGITAILLAVARVPYRVRMLRYEYYSNLLNGSSEQLSTATKKLILEIEKDLNPEVSENLKQEVNEKNKEIYRLLEEFKDNIDTGKRKDAASNFASLKSTFTNYSYKRQQLFNEIVTKYKTYTKWHDYVNINYFKNKEGNK